MNKVAFTQRNIPIDILRAITMLLMIFVNDLWTIKGEPDWLGHADANQDFLGLADVVFPCFLFAVGMSIPYAIERRFAKGLSGVSTVGHILTRTFALLVMGVFIVNTESGVSAATGMSLPVYRILMVAAFFLIWNVYPQTDKLRKHLYTVLKVIGVLLLIYLAIVFRDHDGGIFQARWWGILGIIGWTYVVCAFIYLFTRDRLKYVIPVWLGFVLLSLLKTKMINSDALLNLPWGNFIDEMLGIFHIGNGAHVAFTMGGITLSLINIKFFSLDNGKKAIYSVIAVATLLGAGFVSNQFWIISKIHATPPWVFYCTAAAVGTYALVYWLVSKGKAFWFNIIKPAGTATLTCYLVPYLLYSFMSLMHIHLPGWLTTGWVGVLKCIAFSFIVIGITYLLGRIHIKLKI